MLALLNNNPDDDELANRLKDIITPYGEGKHYEDLPIAKFREMIESLQQVVNNGGKYIVLSFL